MDEYDDEDGDEDDDVDDGEGDIQEFEISVEGVDEVCNDVHEWFGVGRRASSHLGSGFGGAGREVPSLSGVTHGAAEWLPFLWI